MRGNLCVIPGGSVYLGRDLVNSYNVATLDIETRKVTVRYRRYSDMQQAFQKDTDTTGDERDGTFEFDLGAPKQ